MENNKSLRTLMKRRLPTSDKGALDVAIVANEAPRAPKRSRGLILGIPGDGFRRLMDESGALAPAGTYFYEHAAQHAPDRGFYYSQEPVCRGARVQIKLLDGNQAIVRTGPGTASTVDGAVHGSGNRSITRARTPIS